MSFYVAQKVICIDNFAREGFEDEADGYPIKGNIYTVRRVIRWSEPHGLGLYLFEIVRRQLLTEAGYPHERSFAAVCFRPLDERKTNISVFTEILDSVNKRKQVRA